MKNLWLSFLLVLLASLSLQAEVRLPRLISNGMVLQRDMTARVWGWANPGERVTVTFMGSSASASTGADSLWQVGIAVPGAGGPYQMTISGDNRIVLEDILIGDVWVCSGQSNMELSMSRVAPAYPEDIAGADFPAIRQFYVPRHYNFKVPQADVASGDWVKATPETVPAFSAVAFYFGRELHRKTGVPIGLINASLGGSPSEAWLSEEALQAFPHYLEEAMRFRDDSLIANIEKKDNQRREAWYANLDALDRGRLSGQAGWDDPDLDDFSWAEMVLPGFWDQTTFGAVNGVMWFRKTVELPTGLAGQPGDLELGRIVDADSTFVNGVFVGNVTYQYPPRRYHIPEGVLKAGRNVIAVRVVNSSGRGGFVRDKPYRLSVAKDVFDLRGPWKFRLGGEMPPLAGPTFIRWKPMGLYNGMIAPLLKTGIKGVIWYQGESNTGNPGEYRRSFPAVIRDWRQKWGKGDFPFLFVQLANFMQQTRTPVESNWAALREAQQMALAEPNTAMAVTVDIGEWNDIHPLNKRAVGERLALGARHLAYGEKNLAYSGPLYRGMAARGREMVLSFEHVGSGLSTADGEGPGYFAICGADRHFRWARARIEGNRVIVWHPDIENPVAVRYGWADNPVGANLCNKEGLPAGPFRTDDF